MQLSEVFLQDTDKMSGMIESHIPPMSALTSARISAEQSIFTDCGNNKDCVSDRITGIAVNNEYPLMCFVQQHGEKPFEDAIRLFIQAAMIRAGQICYICKATGQSEVDALHILEDEETEAKILNLPGSEYILPPDVSAAIKKYLEYTTYKCTKLYSTDGLVDLVQFLGHKPEEYSYYDFIGDMTQPDPKFNAEYWNDLSLKWEAMPEGSFNSADGDKSGILGVLDDIFSQIGGAAQNTANTVATKSLKEAIVQNLPLIIGIIIVIGIVIYLAVYAANKEA